ncbi:MAG: glycoside hydrolase family 38 N-terminal domain-containing protein, partial [Saccharofermentanales bacterium]
MINKMLDGKAVEKIHIIPYSHHDYAWCCIRNWHITRYIKCFHEVLDTMEENENFTWCIDNVVHSWLPFAENAPEDAERFTQYVRSGRIEILDGGYSLARPSYVGEESYIRNMSAGRKYFTELFGLDDIPCLINADTACGHSQMPQIAKLSGHKYYRFLRSDALLTKKGIPLQFIWEGLDGSRILVTRGIYGSLWALNEWMNNDYEKSWEETKENFINIWLADKLLPEMPTKNIIQFLGSDDCRPLRDAKDNPLRINEFMAEWNKREPVRMEYSSLDKVHKILENEKLPVVSGVLDHSELTYNLPFKGDRSMWRMRLILDRVLVRLEKAALVAWTHGFNYPGSAIQEMWTDLFDITGHAIEFVLKNNYDELYLTADGARLRALKETVKAEEFVVKTLQAHDEIQIIVFNYLNWEHSNLVECEVTTFHGISGFDLIDADGNAAEFQIIDYHNGYNLPENSDFVSARILFKAKVPAMGYAVYTAKVNGLSLKEKIDSNFIDPLVSAEQIKESDRIILNNGELEVVFVNGLLMKITKLNDDNSVVAEEEKAAIKLIFKEMPPSSTWLSEFKTLAVHEFKPIKWMLTQDGPLRQIVTVDGKIAGNDATVEYLLSRGDKGLNVSVVTNFHDAMEGMLVFEVPADDGCEIFADIPFGTEKREFFDELFYKGETGNEEIANSAPAEWELPGQIYGRNWCSFVCNRTPVTIVTEDCSVYYNHDRNFKKMELILNRHMPLKYRTDRWVAQGPDCADGTGFNSYKFSLFFNMQNGSSTDIQRYHKQLIFPLSARLSHKLPLADIRPDDFSLFGDTPENIICTAAYLENGRIFVRMFECNGEPVD